MMAELVASNAKKESMTFSESEEEDNAGFFFINLIIFNYVVMYNKFY